MRMLLLILVGIFIYQISIEGRAEIESFCQRLPVYKEKTITYGPTCVEQGVVRIVDDVKKINIVRAPGASASWIIFVETSHKRVFKIFQFKDLARIKRIQRVMERSGEVRCMGDPMEGRPGQLIAGTQEWSCERIAFISPSGKYLQD